MMNREGSSEDIDMKKETSAATRRPLDEDHQPNADHSSDEDKKVSAAPPSAGKKNGTETFPEKLFSVLRRQDNEGAIQWSENGECFWIVPKKFTDTVLKEHLQGSKFESFNRKLKRWGFRRVLDPNSPADAVVYQHKMFQRNKPELARMIKGARRQAAATLREEAGQGTGPRETGGVPPALNLGIASQSLTDNNLCPPQQHDQPLQETGDSVALQLRQRQAIMSATRLNLLKSQRERLARAVLSRQTGSSELAPGDTTTAAGVGQQTPLLSSGASGQASALRMQLAEATALRQRQQQQQQQLSLAGLSATQPSSAEVAALLGTGISSGLEAELRSRLTEVTTLRREQQQRQLARMASMQATLGGISSSSLRSDTSPLVSALRSRPSDPALRQQQLRQLDEMSALGSNASDPSLLGLQNRQQQLALLSSATLPSTAGLPNADLTSMFGSSNAIDFDLSLRTRLAESAALRQEQQRRELQRLAFSGISLQATLPFPPTATLASPGLGASNIALGDSLESQLLEASARQEQERQEQQERQRAERELLRRLLEDQEQQKRRRKGRHPP